MRFNFVNSSALRILSALLLIIFLDSCLQGNGNSNTPFNPSTIAGTSANLFVLATDASASASSYALNKRDVRQVYEHIATNGGGRIALIRFKANSFNQEPTFIEVPAIDTTSKVQGSNFDKSRQMAQNQQEIAMYQASFQHFLTNLNLENNHKAQFTDISGGLQLIDELMDGSSANQEVIFVTDFINDHPPKHGYNPLKPFQFTSPFVHLHFVRPDERTLGMPVDSLFTGTPVISKYASFRQIFFNRK